MQRTPGNLVARRQGYWYGASMKLVEIEQEALALPDRERASLAVKLPSADSYASAFGQTLRDVRFNAIYQI